MAPLIRDNFIAFCSELCKDFPVIYEGLIEQDGQLNAGPACPLDDQANGQGAASRFIRQRAGEVNRFEKQFAFNDEKAQAEFTAVKAANVDLEKKVNDLKNEIQEMRKQYHKELNSKTGFEMMQERKRNERMARVHDRMDKVGDVEKPKFLDAPNFDLPNTVHYFDPTAGIDEDLRQMLNERIDKVKEQCYEWQLGTTEYISSLLRKVHLYENVSSDYHTLVAMPLSKIFKGIATMEETPEELWTHISKELGPNFFMSVIEKNYSHIFSTTVSKANEEMEKALQG